MRDDPRLAGLVFEPVSRPTGDLVDLIGELDATLGAAYEPEQQHGLKLSELFAPHIRFFLARLDGVAVGCGGIALFDGYGEVKRMYVRERARGRGVAGALLAHIESVARESGRTWLRLETGDRQLAAIRLYERAGFIRCAAFGQYASLTKRAIETSLFFEKRLL